jgi:capsular exopolysaccharide synthesis family protein
MKETAGRNKPYQDGINIKALFFKTIKNWYWFLLFGMVGVLVALIYNHYSPTKYEVSNTVLIKTDAKKESMSTLLSAPHTGYNNSSLTNQVGIIKSYKLNLKTVQNLNWHISIYEKGLFSNADLYLDEPFSIESSKDGIQTVMSPVYITPVSNDAVEIEIKEVATATGSVPVEISKRVRFGEMFTSSYFNFTVKKIEGKPFEIGQQYIAVFNDINRLAHAYKERLDIQLGDEDSDLIYVKLESTQPLRDVNYLNELVKVYLDFGLEEKSKVADNTLKFIHNQLIGITDSLQVASKDFTNFRSRNRIVDLGQEASIVVENLETIEKEEAEVRMRLEYYNNLKAYLNDARQMKDVMAPSVVGITDASLNALVLKLSDLYSQREVLSYSVPEKNPNLVSLDNTIQYTQRTLRENIDNLLSNTSSEIRNLAQRKRRVNAQLSNLPKTEQNMVNIKRSFDLNNDLYTFLLRKRAEVGIARASNLADATILDTARFDAAVRLGPSKIQIILIGFMLGLGLPFFAMIVVDYFDDRLKSPEEVAKQSDIMVAGNILSNNHKTEIPVIQYPNSAISETFRSLRTNLYHLTRDSDKKVFVVHSTLVGEGKSFISINLASVLAINNKKVLLVEADMRKPRLFNVLKLSREDGLSTYLNGKISFDKVVIPSKIKGLSFVGPGQIVTNPSELLNSELLEKFIKEAREHFDYIVIDSVPVGILSDASILAGYADINLIVLRIMYSTRTQLMAVNKSVQEGGIPNAALVLNDLSDDLARKQLKAYGYI